jgi:osmotically-inducible protein OsmY
MGSTGIVFTMIHFLRLYSPLFILLAFLAVPLVSCTPIGLAVGAGATVGTSAAQEGGLGRAFNDAKIQTQINDLWFRSNVDMFRKLDMTVNQGRVLLTGVVQDPEHRVEAVRLAWQANNVQQVINEIRVDEGGGVVGYAKDVWITTRLRTAITLDKDVQSINYNIDTVKGTVYLMGAAQNKLELNKVIETARAIENVVRVVSYVKLIGQQADPGVMSDNAARDNVGQSFTGSNADADNDMVGEGMGYDQQNYGNN